jgi:hypothetical protein
MVDRKTQVVADPNRRRTKKSSVSNDKFSMLTRGSCSMLKRRACRKTRRSKDKSRFTPTGPAPPRIFRRLVILDFRVSHVGKVHL